MPPPFQHVFLLRPYERVEIGQSRWLYTEWSFMGAVAVMLNEFQVQHLHNRVCSEGAMLFYRGGDVLPRPRMGNGLWPLTCVTYVRQMLGLEFRYRTWTPARLWHELLNEGARIVVAPACPPPRPWC